MPSRITITLLICMIGAAIAIAALFLPARQVAAPTPTPPARAVESGAPVDVTIDAFTFSAIGSLSPGQELLVVNNDSVPHTLTADDGSFDTGLLQPGEQALISAPTTAGAFSFFCEVHPAMTGVLTVAG